jgi:hypothetical protein
VIPYPHIIFLLATEGLNKILSKGVALWHFEGLGPPILHGKKI